MSGRQVWGMLVFAAVAACGAFGVHSTPSEETPVPEAGAPDGDVGLEDAGRPGEDAGEDASDAGEDASDAGPDLAADASVPPLLVKCALPNDAIHDDFERADAAPNGQYVLEKNPVSSNVTVGTPASCGAKGLQVDTPDTAALVIPYARLKYTYASPPVSARVTWSFMMNVPSYTGPAVELARLRFENDIALYLQLRAGQIELVGQPAPSSAVVYDKVPFQPGKWLLYRLDLVRGARSRVILRVGDPAESTEIKVVSNQQRDLRLGKIESQVLGVSLEKSGPGIDVSYDWSLLYPTP